MTLRRFFWICVSSACFLIGVVLGFAVLWRAVFPS